MNRLLAILLLVFSLPTLAAPEAAGVKFEDKVKVGAGDTVINGAQKGSELSGEDFYRALLRIRLGENPVQEDLKEELLGKAS